MKYKTFLALLFLFILSTGCDVPIKNLSSHGENIICFGNSITEGSGLARGKAYPEVLKSLVKRNVINAGVSGDTTASALKRLQKDVLDKDPFLVIVELGGNDYLQHTPKTETIKNLEEIINKIHDKKAAVLLCDISSGFIFSGYSQDYRKLARRTNSILVPHLLKGILDNPQFTLDPIHPNEKGQAEIAQRIYKEIERYIRF